MVKVEVVPVAGPEVVVVVETVETEVMVEAAEALQLVSLKYR